MTGSSQEVAAREGLDATQVLSVVNRPLEPERTRDVLINFTSGKDYVEIVRRLNQEDAAKLVDVFDQVCRASIRDTLTLLTTTVMTRSSAPSIGGRHKTRRC